MTRHCQLVCCLIFALSMVSLGSLQAQNPLKKLRDQIGDGGQGIVIRPPNVTIPGFPDVTKPIREEAQNAKQRMEEAQRLFERARREVRELTRIETNRQEIQNSLSNGWYVAPGKEIDHIEYLNFSTAVSSSVALNNPGPVQLYLNYMLAQMKAELSKSLQGEARQFLRDIEMNIIRSLQQSLTTGRPVNVTFGGVDVQIGIATYNHRKKISGNYPELHGTSIKWRSAERFIPLPNTHQPYVRFRVRYQVR
jgi:hypothetical protein